MRKINFLGMEMMVADEEDRAKASPGTFYVMVQVAESPDTSDASPQLRARRIKVRCDRCRELCWLDPESYKGFPRSLQRICTQCLEKKLIQQQQENA